VLEGSCGKKPAKLPLKGGLEAYALNSRIEKRVGYNSATKKILFPLAQLSTRVLTEQWGRALQALNPQG